MSRARGASTEPVLACEQLVKRYGAQRALDGVSLAVAPGELVALLGPNGAGKSTLFQILTGLFVPDAGDVRVLGEDMRRSPVKALARLGVVFQQPALDLNLDVWANLCFHTDLHGIRRVVARARIAQGLQDFGLVEHAGKPTRALSGGNRRKVELLRALLHNPDLLLMDEATVGLDPASRRQLMDQVLARVQDQQLGVLWATHLVEEAERAHRIVVMHRGRILYDGDAPGLCEQAAEATVEAAFLRLTRPGGGGSPEGTPKA